MYVKVHTHTPREAIGLTTATAHHGSGSACPFAQGTHNLMHAISLRRLSRSEQTNLLSPSLERAKEGWVDRMTPHTQLCLRATKNSKSLWFPDSI